MSAEYGTCSAHPNIEQMIAGLPGPLQFMATAFMASKSLAELDSIENELPALLAQSQPALEEFSETGNPDGVKALLAAFGVDDATATIILGTLDDIRKGE